MAHTPRCPFGVVVAGVIFPDPQVGSLLQFPQGAGNPGINKKRWAPSHGN